MEDKHKVQLEKILPIINGLLFLSTENRQKVLKEGIHIKALFDIFKYQIPIELHENALYALINVLQECPKTLKQQIFDLGVATPLLKFTHDLFEIETEILRDESSMIVFADYKIEWNPEYSNLKILNAQRDLTLAEMQQQRLIHQMYIWNHQKH